MRYATFFFLSGSVLTYLASAFIAGEGSNRFVGALGKVWRMPSLYGVALALLVLATGQRVPEFVLRPVSLLSESALPLMILVLGMQLERTAMPARPKLVALAVAISVLVAPLVALGLTAAFGISGPARQAAVTLSSMPVAVITTIFALEFDLSADFATAAVFLSTILSPLTLTPLIAYLQ
jgi:predicted permease